MSLRSFLTLLILTAATVSSVKEAEAAKRRSVRSPVNITLASIFPSSATAGGAGFTLSLEGSGVPKTAVVRWNGSDRPTSVLDPAHIEASISAADIAVAGTARARIYDPSSATLSNELTFHVVDGITVNVTPQSSDVPFETTRKFTALVTGTADTRVTWTATSNTIAADGTFTAPVWVEPGQAIIRATSVADPRVKAEAVANIVPPTPVISALSTTEASAGSEISIMGAGYYAGSDRATVVFPAGNGIAIPSLGYIRSPTRITAEVPLGASSGPLHVEMQYVRFPVVRSNDVPFRRTPRLLIRSRKRDLASGESLQLDLRFLGDPQPRPVIWSAERGTVSPGGFYRAPVVSADTLDRVRVCLPASAVCATRLLGIHPLRIEPVLPAVRLGETLPLSAVQNDTRVFPAWTLKAGWGDISNDGVFTAPTLAADSGAMTVTASHGGGTAESVVAVTGAIPGIVNRIRDYLNTSANPVPEGTLTYAIAAAGRFAYVLSNDLPTIFGTTKNYWIDVYDVSNPASPVWLDAVESVSPAEAFPSPPRIFADGSSFFVIPLYAAGPGGRVPLAVFDMVGDRARLSAIALLPVFANSLGVLGAGTFTGSSLYGPATSSNQLSPLAAFRTEVGGSAGQRSITSAELRLPLPAPWVAGHFDGIAGSGNRLYIAFRPEAPGSLPPTVMIAYDLSIDPARIAGTVALRGCCGMKIKGSRMFVGKELFDISGDLPVSIGTLPVDAPGNVSDFNSSWAVVQPGQAELLTFDLRDPAQLKPHAVLFDGVIQGSNGVLAGDHVLGVNWNGGLGGLASYDAAPSGGALKKSELKGGGTIGTIYDQRIDANRLYWAVNTDDGPFVNIHDLSTSPPVSLGRYSEAGHVPLSLQPIGDLLFVGNSMSLTVLNVSNPSVPAKVTELAFPVSCLGLLGSRLIAGTTDNRLVVVNVSTPSSPVVTATIPLPGFPVNIKVTANLALVAADTAGLLIYDISQATPALLSQFRPSLAVTDVAIDGTLAFLAAVDAGLLIVDVSDPVHPRAVGRGALSRFAEDDGLAISVAIDRNIAYVGASGLPSIGEGNGAVYGFDYRQPDRPRLVSLSAYGPFLESEVATYSFFGSDIFVGGTLSRVTVRQYDNTQPRNVLHLDYPSRQLEGIPRPLGGSGAPICIHPKMRVPATN